MGAEINKSHFSLKDHDSFKDKLNEETSTLIELEANKQFCDNGYSIGSELEACFIDSNSKMQHFNEEFLKQSNHSQIVHELCKANIEFNSLPFNITNDSLTKMHAHLLGIYDYAKTISDKSQKELLLIGTYPSLDWKNINKDMMTKSIRYDSLNRAMFGNSGKKRLNLKIEGTEILEEEANNIMPAALATSFQYHFKVPISEAVRALNINYIISAPLIALSSNSPYVCGKELWEESRVPLFEQSVNGITGQRAKRAFFGRGYINKSFTEYFVNNTAEFDTLIPVWKNTPVDSFEHLKLHNGTIWTWSRPVLGNNSDGTHHFRVEQRCAAAGPTVHDGIANMAFTLGLMKYYLDSKQEIESLIKFEQAQSNFYSAAKSGLQSNIIWKNNKTVNLQELMLNELIPNAKRGLESIGISSADISKYIDQTITPRVSRNLTGAQWQKQSVKKHKGCFNKMMQSYLTQQKQDLPVHSWEV